MPRPLTQARAARRLRREPWIAADPDAAALATQLVYLAQEMDEAVAAGDGFAVEPLGRAYLETRAALLALKPKG